MHIFVVTGGRWPICCLLCNKIQNKLKYNFSGSVSLLQVATVTGISTHCFENFQRFELRRVLFPGIFPTVVEKWFEFAGVSIIEGSRNWGQNYSVRVRQIQGKRQLSHREVPQA